MNRMTYLLVASSLLTACSPSSSVGPAGGNAPDASVPAPAKGYFEIFLDQFAVALEDGSTDMNVTLAAEAFPISDAGAPSLVSETNGPCFLRVRATTDAGAFATSTENVGTITVSGGSLPDGGISIGPSNTTEQPLELTSARAFRGGEPLTVSASGGSLPGFDARSVKTPSEIQITSPASVDVDGVPLLDRTQDLTLRWTGGDEGTVEVSIVGRSPAAGTRTTISCSYPAKAGEGVIPAKMLAHLPLTDADAGARTSAFATPTTVDTVRHGDWDYDIYVSNTYHYWTPQVTR